MDYFIETSAKTGNNAKNVLIEAAIFRPYNIRKTEKHLNLRSEASMRYEKGLNYEYTIAALDRACHLLEAYAEGKVLSGVALYDKEDKTLKKVTFTRSKINSLLGIDLSIKDIEDQLDNNSMNKSLNSNNKSIHSNNKNLNISQSLSINQNDLNSSKGRRENLDKIELRQYIK